MKTYLILDTNCLVADWLMRGAVFSGMRTLPDTQVAVPAVVLVEVAAAHQRAVEQSSASVARALRERHRLGFPAQDLRGGARDIEFAERLTERLEWLGAVVLPWPDVSHEVLTQRAADRTPPFDNKGGGYRDTLVWFSALALAESGARVHLASADRAFAGPDRALSPVLVKEVAVSGPGEIHLVPTLREWVLARAPMGEPTSAHLSKQHMSTFVEFINGWQFEDLWLSASEVGLPAQEANIAIVQMVESRDIEVSTEKTLLDGGTYVE